MMEFSGINGCSCLVSSIDQRQCSSLPGDDGVLSVEGIQEHSCMQH